MAVELMTNRSATRKRSVSKAVVARVQELLAGNYAFMDSVTFHHNRNVEKELFAENPEPPLPLTSWYQPTRDEAMRDLKEKRVIVAPVLPEVFFMIASRMNYSAAVRFFKMLQSASPCTHNGGATSRSWWC